MALGIYYNKIPIFYLRKGDYIDTPAKSSSTGVAQLKSLHSSIDGGVQMLGPFFGVIPSLSTST